MSLPSASALPADDEPRDDRLVEQARAGDEEAFAELYRRRSTGLYRFALHMSGSRDIAEEVTQDAFMALVDDAARYDASRGAVAAFLYGVARNLVLRQLRRLGPVALEGSDEALDRAAADHDPHADVVRQQEVARVRRAIASLPPHYREAVLLCDIEGLEYAEAASALECPIGTVRSRLARARALLATKLRPTPHAVPATDLRTIRCTP